MSHFSTPTEDQIEQFIEAFIGTQTAHWKSMRRLLATPQNSLSEKNVKTFKEGLAASFNLWLQKNIFSDSRYDFLQYQYLGMIDGEYEIFLIVFFNGFLDTLVGIANKVNMDLPNKPLQDIISDINNNTSHYQ